MMDTRNPNAEKIVPVILSGGAGTRLWPLSRRLRPKQFLVWHGEHSVFTDTLERVTGDAFDAPVVVCNDEHRFLVLEALRRGGFGWRDIILEPCARNTAPAIAAVALRLAACNPELVISVLPSDHVVGDSGAFHEALTTAAALARDGRMVTFGVRPVRPDTGFG